MRDSVTEPLVPRPSDDELLARELEGMAQRATGRDHVASPIVDMIARAPSARPFVAALRTLVSRLTCDRIGAPYGSIVVGLVRDCDLDAAVKLELLREFFLCERDDFWRFKRRDDLVKSLKKRDDTLASAIIDVARAGGRAGLDALVAWAGEARQLAGGASMSEAVGNLLHILAERDPSGVLDALEPMPSGGARDALSQVARHHPNEALAFARRCVAEGAAFAAIVAMDGLERSEPVCEEIRELATAIASDPTTGGVRGFALMMLLGLPTVAPTVWELVRALPHPHWVGLPRRLGYRLRDGLLEPLDVLEEWMRMPDLPEGLLADVALAFGLALDRFEGHRLERDLEARVVADLAEAWRRGAPAARVAGAVEMALRGHSDAEYASLGLEALARALVPIDAQCRRHLFRTVTLRRSVDAAWPTQLVAQIADASDAGENLDHVSELARECAHPDRWSEEQIERLLTACRPSMTAETAVAACRAAVPCDGWVAGLRPILAWFAREFPADEAIRQALARVMRAVAGERGLAGDVGLILGGDGVWG